MMPRSVIVCCSLLVARVGAHGTLTKPTTRNRGPLDKKAPPDFDAGNGGGKFDMWYNGGAGHSPCGDGLWGYSNNHGGGGVGWHYRGGDAANASLHESYKNLLAEHNPELTQDWRQLYVVGQPIDVQAEITAYHGGHMTFHLCEIKEGELDFDAQECGVLAKEGTEEFRKNQLLPLEGHSNTLPPANKFCTNCDGVADGVVCGFDPGCFGYGPDPHYSGNHFAAYEFMLQPPTRKMERAVLVWHWFTDNNGEGFAGQGEEFMNCADVTIVAAAGPTASPVTSPTAAPQATPTAAPTSKPPVPTAEPTAKPPVPTSSPTPSGSGGCRDNPDYPHNPADGQCAKCGAPDYYEWWPCNVQTPPGSEPMCVGECSKPELVAVKQHEVAEKTKKKARKKSLRAGRKAQQQSEGDETAYMQQGVRLNAAGASEDFEEGDEFEDEDEQFEEEL